MAGNESTTKTTHAKSPDKPDLAIDPNAQKGTEAGGAGKPNSDKFDEVQSNHNSSSPARPLVTANLIGKPDYNPMRELPTKGNNDSDTTHTPETSKALVDEKGDRPTHAEVVINGGTDQAGRDMPGLAKTPPVVKSPEEVAKVL